MWASAERVLKYLHISKSGGLAKVVTTAQHHNKLPHDYHFGNAPTFGFGNSTEVSAGIRDLAC